MTRIMDLPENITVQMTPVSRGDGFNTSYAPMDIHPNPYGHPSPSVQSIPTPSSSSEDNFQKQHKPQYQQHQAQQHQAQQQQQYNHQAQQQQHHNHQAPQHHQAQQQSQTRQFQLPSRDIPRDQSDLTQDPQILANYLPPVLDSERRTTNYLKQYEANTVKKIADSEHEKEKQTKLDRLIEQGHIPVLISMLFFIFHMPIVDQFFIKNLSFLTLTTTDGNFNANGLILRSVFFGSLVFGVTNTMNILSNHLN